VPAKYRDPATGTGWSGRGLQPKWLKAALADGRKLSDFAV
jgi:DNA-binding protein H-NS